MEDILEAWLHVLRTKEELGACYAAGDYDRGYFCTAQDLAYQRAVAELDALFTRFIDARIAAAGPRALGEG
jgi:hypothetical protein